MFTGLIEAVGEVARLEGAGATVALSVSTALAPLLSPGESVSVSGICLTVVTSAEGLVRFDVGPETIRVSTAGTWAPGHRVNLERSMAADGRFGGHFVQGHVDAAGVVRRVRASGDVHDITVAYPPRVAPFLVEKGSIAVDGVSLTIAAMRADEFDVMIVPFTWTHTSLDGLREGGTVNLECDMVGKYVARAVELATARTT